MEELAILLEMYPDADPELLRRVFGLAC